MQAVTPGTERFALDLHVVRDGEDCILIGSGTPRIGLVVAEAGIDQTVGNEFAPDLAAPVLAGRAVNRRAGVIDADLDGSDVLNDGGFLVVTTGRKGQSRRTLSKPGAAQNERQQSGKRCTHRARRRTSFKNVRF